MCLISILTLSSTNALISFGDGEDLIRLTPWLNVVSTPAIVKEISFENWWNNISIATMEKWYWKPITINKENVSSIFRPLNGYIVRNDNPEDVYMTLVYDKDIDISDAFLSKKLDAGWNFLWITKENKPFNNIAEALATTIIDLTDWSNFSNKIILWKTFKDATSFVLWKAYGVFINNFNWIYGWTNNLGDGNELGQWELTNEITENIDIEMWKNNKKTVFNWYFTAKDNSMKLYKISILCMDEACPCFSDDDNLKFNVTLGWNSYVTTNNWEISLNDILLEKWESIPLKIDIDITPNNSKNWVNYYILRINGKSNWAASAETTLPYFNMISENWYTYNNNLVYSYDWAYENWIISESNIDDANLYEELSIWELIVTMNKFSDKILKQTPDTSKNCEFVNNENSNIIKSCQLWLIEENDNIDFNSNANMAIFWTMLSRALRWSKYDYTPYYSRHLKFLLRAEILDEDNVWDIEKDIVLWNILPILWQTDIDINNCLMATAQCLENPNSCPVDCKPNYILSNNLNKFVEFKTNDNNRRVVFDGTFTALERPEKIHWFWIVWDYVAAWDYIDFYVSINWEELWEISLDENSNNKYTRNSDKAINVNKGESVNVRTEAKFFWTNSDKIYDYWFILSREWKDDEGWSLPRFYVDLAPIKISNNIDYSDELIEAYERAYENEIITEDDIDDVNLYDEITNLELANIINNFAENVLDQAPDVYKSCTFDDILDLTSEEKNIITKSCQLWLMPAETNSLSFNPNESVNRAIFGTVLSRALWGSAYEWGTPYYANHLSALKAAWIMNQIDDPVKIKEIKWYVLVMLMKAS